MKKLICLFAVAAVAGASHAASLKGGTREIVVDGSLDPQGVGGGVDLDISAGYGYFVQDSIEVGAEVALADNDLVTSYGFAGFAEFNFDQGTPLVPFVGARAGWARVEIDQFDADADAVVMGGYAGVKYFLAENVAITGQLNLNVASDDIYVNDDEVDDTNIDFTVGMRFFLP